MEFHGDIPVTYRDGVFEPEHAVSLPSGAKGRVSVLPETPTPEARRAAWELFERIRREKLVRLGGWKFDRSELYDRR